MNLNYKKSEIKTPLTNALYSGYPNLFLSILGFATFFFLRDIVWSGIIIGLAEALSYVEPLLLALVPEYVRLLVSAMDFLIRQGDIDNTFDVRRTKTILLSGRLYRGDPIRLQEEACDVAAHYSRRQQKECRFRAISSALDISAIFHTCRSGSSRYFFQSTWEGWADGVFIWWPTGCARSAPCGARIRKG